MTVATQTGTRSPSASPARTRQRGPLLMLALATAVLASYVAVWAHLSHVDEVGSDYSTFHVAALLWRDGDAGHLYDQGAENARHLALVPRGYHVDLPFISPPSTVLLTAPFTALDLPAAFRAASLVQLALVVAAVAVAVRAAPRPAGMTAGELVTVGATAAAGVGTLVVLLMGQWDGMCALGLALGYAAWRRDHHGLAGLSLALAFLPAKPHLALGIAAFLVGRRELRALGGAAAGAVLTLGAGVAVDGFQGWADWLGALRLSSSHSPLASLLGTTGLAGSWLGDTAAAHALGLAAGALAVTACAVLGNALRRRPRHLEPALAAAAALSLVAAPHLLMHDLSVLAPASAWMLLWAAGVSARWARRATAGWLLLNLTCLLDLGRGGVGPPGRLVPLALLGLGAAGVALTAARQSGRGSGVGGVVLQS